MARCLPTSERWKMRGLLLAARTCDFIATVRGPRDSNGRMQAAAAVRAPCCLCSFWTMYAKVLTFTMMSFEERGVIKGGWWYWKQA